MSYQFLAIFSLFIGICTTLFILLILTYFCKKKVESIKLEEEAGHLLDERLDSIMNGLKEQIPMGASLITGVLNEKLKNFGKRELIKMMPSLKEKIYQRYLLQAFYWNFILLVILGGVFGLLMGMLAGYVWLR